MRKGRSSRRSRVSRPSIGPKTMQNVEASAAEPASPNVVIGVSVPPPAASEPPPRVEADAATSVAPALAPSPEAHETRASEQRLKAEAAAHAEKAIEQLDSAPPPPEETREEKLDAKAEDAKAEEEEKADAKVEETTKAEATEATKETKTEASVAARDELTPPPPATTIDEESIPPVGDLAVHEKFFSQGDLGAIAADDEDDLELAAPDKAKRKSAPEVVQRRARFVRYVTWAVGVSAVVCLAAVVRTAMAPSSKTIAAPAQAAMIIEPPAAKAAPPTSVEVQPAAPVAATEPEPATTTTTTAAAPEAPAPAEPEAAKPAPPGDEVKGDAKEEKASCKKALERGKIADAIEAGERAVALDETDAEAWLLLGAAYQEKGKLADARRAYTSCVKLGSKSKHTTECAQMLR